LVVEDEAIIARDIAMQLRDLGFDVLGPVASGEKAIVLAGELRPDLVLMDIHLAGALDGIATAVAIREQFNVPTVYLSAFDTADSLARARLAMPLGYLSKPFTDRALRELMALALPV
jgi:CheY-like chemotaxis protein